jgi:hypothetical protein
MTRTITLNRTRAPHEPPKCSDPFIDITVELKLLQLHCETDKEGWHVTTSIDEDGNPITLTSTETLLARCLAAAGVDETGV